MEFLNVELLVPLLWQNQLKEVRQDGEKIGHQVHVYLAGDVVVGAYVGGAEGEGEGLGGAVEGVGMQSWGRSLH